MHLTHIQRMAWLETARPLFLSSKAYLAPIKSRRPKKIEYADDPILNASEGHSREAPFRNFRKFRQRTGPIASGSKSHGAISFATPASLVISQSSSRSSDVWHRGVKLPIISSRSNQTIRAATTNEVLGKSHWLFTPVTSSSRLSRGRAPELALANVVMSSKIIPPDVRRTQSPTAHRSAVRNWQVMNLFNAHETSVSPPDAANQSGEARERASNPDSDPIRQKSTVGNDGRQPRQSGASTLHIDGAALGRWALQHLERTLGRPANGMTGVDPRAITPRTRVAPF